jgi:hypothetical protein
LDEVIAEHEAIKEVALLRESVEKGGGAARVGVERGSSLVEHGNGERRRERKRREKRGGKGLSSLAPGLPSPWVWECPISHLTSKMMKTYPLILFDSNNQVPQPQPQPLPHPQLPQQ